MWCNLLFRTQNTYDTEKDAQNSMDDEVVLASSSEGYNSVVVYQLHNALIVSAESEAVMHALWRAKIKPPLEVEFANLELSQH